MRPSSVITRALGPRVNLAVPASLPTAEADCPSPIASEELKASIRNMPGWWASNAAFTDSLHMTPELEINTRLDRSHLPGLASRAATIGFANASPTIARAPTARRSIVSRISVTFSVRSSSVTTDPPPTR